MTQEHKDREHREDGNHLLLLPVVSQQTIQGFVTSPPDQFPVTERIMAEQRLLLISAGVIKSLPIFKCCMEILIPLYLEADKQGKKIPSVTPDGLAAFQQSPHVQELLDSNTIPNFAELAHKTESLTPVERLHQWQEENPYLYKHVEMATQVEVGNDVNQHHKLMTTALLVYSVLRFQAESDRLATMSST